MDIQRATSNTKTRISRMELNEIPQEQRLQEVSYRLKLIKEILATENRERQEKSQEDFDVFSGNILPYVKRKLLERFSVSLVKEVPIVSAINTLKKEIKSKASLYKSTPERMFSELSDDQLEVVKRVYEDMRIDAQMLSANELYELQDQTHVLIEPRNGKLTARPVKCHQLNVVPNEIYPEDGEIYIFSAFDKGQSDLKSDNSNGTNEKIGDLNDYDGAKDRYIVWSKSFHFVMDGNGLVLSEDIVSPLLSYGILPVVEIAAMKDFTYWIAGNNEAANFCVDFNSTLSMQQQTVELQSFGQAYLKTTAELMPTSIDVGPTRILRLVMDPNSESGDKTEFGFASPGADIAGAMENSRQMLSMYLSSQGQDPSTITTSGSNTDKATSGVDRYLKQLEKFESSKEAMDLFRDAEVKIYRIVKAWLNVLRGSDVLDKKYLMGSDLPGDSELNIEYSAPNIDLTNEEKLNVIEREKDLNLKTDVEHYAEYRNVSIEEAEKAQKEFDSVPEVVEINA